jgi:hypothetical protein
MRLKSIPAYLQQNTKRIILYKKNIISYFYVLLNVHGRPARYFRLLSFCTYAIDILSKSNLIRPAGYGI